ncbi:putative methyltransferase PMT24 [Curcuma longa]|uniref:putative methyltransferase PMT24 n=1 Tax=Curcuma longa TaxID=136217 RepID=UPI003D9F64D8
MAFGKNPLMDSRRPSSSLSSHWSTMAPVLFIALCLIGVWMMSSTTIVPIDESLEDKSEMKQQVTETDPKTYQDSSGDVPDEATRRDADANMKDLTAEPKSEPSEEQNMIDKADENPAETTKNDDFDKDNEGKKDGDSNQTSYNEEIGNAEGGETIKEGDVNAEEASQETTDSDREKNAAQQTYSDENGKTEGGEMVKESESKEQSFQSTTTVSEQGKIAEQDPMDQDKSSENTSDFASNGEVKNNDGEMIKERSETQEGGREIVPEKRSEENQRQESNDKGGQESNEASSEQQNKGDLSDEALLPNGAQSELLNESNSQNGAWSTQATESKNEKQTQAASKEGKTMHSWKLCNVAAGTDYIPCLDNERAIKKLKTTNHYEHRERHCPDDPPTCLVPLPEGYKQSIQWPHSRNKIWFHNVPYTSLATVKGHQNWVKVSGEYLTFPGGGTQFINGALHYIDFIQKSVPGIAWGKHSRVALDVGCGVASFGGFLFDRDVLTMSFAPKDEHEAQVQFALERGIPAISSVMGTKRLSFPAMAFDVVHCARCRVPWHIEGGKLLLELNRLLRPGGYFVWSATPVYQELPEDVEIWEAMTELTKSMCWDMINKTEDKINRVGMAIYRKPTNNECYDKRTQSNPPLCEDSDDPNAAWNIPLQACMHKLPVDPVLRGSRWPQPWPQRLNKAPYWLNHSLVGVYGKPAPKDFTADTEHWKYVVKNSYLKGMGVDWSIVRNVMDMSAVYGGFAAALREVKEVNAWVMNVVSIDSPDTLPIIYERGLFGIYHDWCESFSTYPRSYDLLHADHLFSRLKKRCKLLPVISEVDRMLRPQGKLIVRDTADAIREVESMARSLNYEVKMTSLGDKEGFLCVQKTMWRPKEVEISSPST